MKEYIKYSLIILIGFLMFYIGGSLLKGTSAAPANGSFKDNNFYKCVIDGYNLTIYNKFLDGEIPESQYIEVSYDTNLTNLQLQTIEYLKCNNYTKDNFSLDVTGLNLLTNLEELYLAGNSLDSLNISSNIKLKKLVVESNNLTTLDVSSNTLLEELDISNNNIISINLENNKKLKKIDLSNNMIELTTGSEFNNNNLLQELYLSNNKINNIDISTLSELEILNIDGNNLSTLSVNTNAKLKELSVSDNQLVEISGITNTKLTELNLVNNKITNLKIDSSNLLTLNVSGNKLTTLDVENAITLETLIANDNEITELNLNDSLKYIQLSNNNLSNISLDGLSNLVDLHLANNELSSIDVSKNTYLNYLSLRNNKISDLNINNNPRLQSLLVDYNKLTSLNTNNNSLLNVLYAEGNQISSLNVNNNKELRILDISDNKLTSIDLSNNDKLTLLSIDGNSFEEEIYVYKGNEHTIGTNVKISSSMEWDNPNWNTDNPSVATITDNQKVLGNNVGSALLNGEVTGKYTNKSNVNVIEIKSEKYNIDGDFINVGTDSEVSTIKNNIEYDNNLELVVSIENKSLDVKYNEEILKKFTLVIESDNNEEEGEEKEEHIFILSDNYKILEDNIVANIDVGTTIENFDVEANNKLTFYDVHGEVVNSGILKTGYKVSDGIVEYTLIIKGDIDGNGLSDEDDIKKLSKHIININRLEGLELLAGNIDFNDSININDVIKLVRYIY